jgi:hypothetical protein
LVRAHVRRRGLPRGLEIRREREQGLARDARRRRQRPGGEPGLTLLEPRERRVPPRLELGGDESIVRIDGLVAPLGQGDVVLGLLAFQLQRAPALIEVLARFPFGHASSFHGDRLHRKKNLLGDGGIRAPRPHRDAAGQAVHRVADPAHVSRLGAAASATVRHMEHPAAASTPQEARQQGLTPAPRPSRRRRASGRRCTPGAAGSAQIHPR